MCMKKIIIITLLTSFAFGTFGVLAAGAPYPNRPLNKNLSRGLCDPDVQFLQEYLQSHGYISTQTQLTGYFGSVTFGAVKKLQADNSISSTGFVGPLTRAFFNAEYAKYVAPQPTGYGSGLLFTPKCIYDKIPVAPIPSISR